eukprot:2359072-Karenia_brevis.AAC.1
MGLPPDSASMQQSSEVYTGNTPVFCKSSIADPSRQWVFESKMSQFQLPEHAQPAEWLNAWNAHILWAAGQTFARKRPRIRKSWITERTGHYAKDR